MIPGSANPLLLKSAAAAAGALQIERSLRFNSSDSAYLSRTPGTAGNRRTWTWSGWVKRSALSASTRYGLFGTADAPGTSYTIIEFYNDTIRFLDTNSGGTTEARITSAIYRDPSAWMNIALAYDTTQATASNRIKLYVNGSEVTQFSTSSNPSQNSDAYLNQAVPHTLGSSNTAGTPSFYFSGYLANIHFIDGQQLTPNSFTETDATTGQLIPKTYTGSYGTNGFNLLFADNSSNTASTLGKDTSGLSNNWTPNNLSVTAGAGNDSLVDSPTNYGTDTGVGGTVRGNYCTWNPLINGDTAANGNLDVTNDTARGTHKLLDYNAYWEITSIGGTTTAGVVSDGGTTNTTTIANGKTYGFKLSTAGALEYINITDSGSFTSITTGLTGIRFPYASAAASTTGSLNAGQRAFAYTAPSGFKALCTQNLPEGTITTSGTYTGNGVADGPFVYLNGVPTAMTVGVNAVTFGTHADKLSNGFKLRTTNVLYNQNALSYSYSITTTGAKFKYARAQPNP